MFWHATIRSQFASFVFLRIVWVHIAPTMDLEPRAGDLSGRVSVSASRVIRLGWSVLLVLHVGAGGGWGDLADQPSTAGQ